MAHSFLILAQAAGGNPMGTLIFVAVLAAIMYFIMIRPQQKQLKAHRDLVAGLKKGDEVITQGGMLGKIHLVSERTVTLEISSGVRIRVLKTSIAGKGTVSDDGAKPEEKKEEK
ncbi:preprotein translocase subunit YajC [Myxococcaceae bacterium GXIMD 01537]